MKTLAKAGLSGAAALALTIAGVSPALISPALADPNPIGSSASNGDIVAVGSDTLEFGDDFVADGAGLNNGYNFFHPSNRYVSFDAVDPYTQLGATGGVPVGGSLPTTFNLIRLRGAGGGTYGLGTNPGLATGSNLIPRPNGSTEGKQSILPASGCGSRSGTDGYPAAPISRIDVARASSALSGTQDTTSCLQQAPFATDPLTMAVATSGTNMPSGGLTVTQIGGIYEPDSCSAVGPGCPTATPLRKWTDVGGTSTDNIVPIIPQVGSGTYNSFTKDIFGSNVPTSFNPNTIVTEEHSPAEFASPTHGESAADLIAPFSGGRITMINGGYFNFLHPTWANSVTAVPGQGTGASQIYEDDRTLYHDVRAAATSATWAATLLGPSGFFCSSTATPLLTLAGEVQLTSGCGTFS